MNLNVTLFIQACNFFIVYWMLRIFLFKPVVTIINNEHAEDASIMSIIGQQKTSLEIQEKERQHRWTLCREYFKAHQVPTEIILIESVGDREVSVKPISAPEIDYLANQISMVLEEKIKHVH